MKAASFAYRRPEDVSDASALLGNPAFEDAKLLAGGQSLGPMMNFRVARPDLLVDVSGLEALRSVSSLGENILIGAAVSHARIEDGAVPGRLGKILASIASGIAHRAVRNRGTIGGSLAHADPAADWPSALLALGAQIHIASADGSRTLDADDFLVGIFETALGHKEVLSCVELQPISDSACWGYDKVCRKPGEFADAIGAVFIDSEASICRLVIGAGQDRPILLPNARDLLDSGLPDSGLDPLLGDFDPYEKHIHKVVLRRAASKALEHDNL